MPEFRGKLGEKSIYKYLYQILRKNYKLLKSSCQKNNSHIERMSISLGNEIILEDRNEQGYYNPVVQDYKDLTMGSRLLIIAPHPDDETLACAGLILQAVREGKEVRVVFITNGDGFSKAVTKNYGIRNPQPQDYLHLGYDRHQEALSAARLLGLAPKDLLFLGYPDGGIMDLWEKNWDYAQPKLALNGHICSPYSFSYEGNALHCGANLVKNLIDILAEFYPTDIFYPHEDDEHQDHKATNAFVQYTLTLQGYAGREWTYIVHKYVQQMDLYHVPLTPEETKQKCSAIREYHSQWKVAEDFMSSFFYKKEYLGPRNKIYLTYGNKYHPSSFPELRIIIQTKNKIDTEKVYTLQIRCFYEKTVGRLDLLVHRGKIYTKKHAYNRWEIAASALALKIQENKVGISLPFSTINGVKALLINSVVLSGNKILDKTAYKLVMLKKLS